MDVEIRCGPAREFPSMAVSHGLNNPRWIIHEDRWLGRITDCIPINSAKPCTTTSEEMRNLMGQFDVARSTEVRIHRFGLEKLASVLLLAFFQLSLLILSILIGVDLAFGFQSC